MRLRSDHPAALSLRSACSAFCLARTTCRCPGHCTSRQCKLGQPEHPHLPSPLGKAPSPMHAGLESLRGVSRRVSQESLSTDPAGPSPSQLLTASSPACHVSVGLPGSVPARPRPQHPHPGACSHDPRPALRPRPLSEPPPPGAASAAGSHVRRELLLQPPREAHSLFQSRQGRSLQKHQPLSGPGPEQTCPKQTRLRLAAAPLLCDKLSRQGTT